MRKPVLDAIDKGRVKGNMAAVVNDLTRHLCDLPDWTPLRELGFPFAEVHEPLFRVAASDLYVVAQDTTAAFESGHPGAPFVRAIVWAPSEGAARRAVLSQLDQDDGAIGVPPDEFAGVLRAMGHADLIKHAPVILSGRLFESAEYAGAPAAQFVQCMVGVKQWSFCFRSTGPKQDDLPFAIVKRLG